MMHEFLPVIFPVILQLVRLDGLMTILNFIFLTQQAIKKERNLKDL